MLPGSIMLVTLTGDGVPCPAAKQFCFPHVKGAHNIKQLSDMAWHMLS
jgi:hypothetical protein